MGNQLKPLIIGDIKLPVPIIQGGMGVKVSTASLASAVANCGGAGTIASVGLGYGRKDNDTNYLQASLEGLREEIRKAKKLTNGVVGVNMLVALSNYEDLVRTAVEEKVDFIISGAGLPLKLPEVVGQSNIKLIPIVSSGRAADLIIKTWKKRYNKIPDAIIVEGPLAGGHLGFKFDDLKPTGSDNLEDLVVEVLKVVKEREKEFDVSIPVIAAGGIWDGKDMAKFIKLGVSGVQIATRFVATDECDVHDNFKKLYLEAKDEDIMIIKSPVGMPGRSIKTKFVEKMAAGEKVPIKCNYRCLKGCNPTTVPYCIAKALFNAASGKIDEAVVFCGSNVSKVDKIVSVKELMDTLVAETEQALAE